MMFTVSQVLKMNNSHKTKQKLQTNSSDINYLKNNICGFINYLCHIFFRIICGPWNFKRQFTNCLTILHVVHVYIYKEKKFIEDRNCIASYKLNKNNGAMASSNSCQMLFPDIYPTSSLLDNLAKPSSFFQKFFFIHLPTYTE